jgi:serine/threonine protein kinase
MTTPGGLRRTVAVKLPRVTSSVRHTPRLIDEAKVLAHLDHPSFPTVFDVVSMDGLPALVMGYLPGNDLRQCLAQGVLPPRAAMEIVAQIARGLHSTEDIEVNDELLLLLVHCDIKPSNIRITHRGRAVLIDFGVAECAGRTQTSGCSGTLNYMAPERLDGGYAEEHTDIYALGCVLYELLTCRRYQQATDRVRLSAMLSPARYPAHLEAALRRVAYVPGAVDLVASALAFEPHQRCSAEYFAIAAEAAARALPGRSFADWAYAQSWTDTSLEAEWVGRTVVSVPFDCAPTDVFESVTAGDEAKAHHVELPTIVPLDPTVAPIQARRRVLHRGAIASSLLASAASLVLAASALVVVLGSVLVAG